MNSHLHPIFAQIINALPSCQLSRNAVTLGNFGSPLMVTDRGTGFLDRARDELHLAFGILELRGPVPMRPATTQEAREFFLHRAATRNEQTAYYDRKDARGESTGD